MQKTFWLTTIFLHLPVRAEALKAALGTAGHLLFYPRGTASPLEPCPKCGGTLEFKLPDKPKFERSPLPPTERNHKNMDISLIIKVAGVGILVSVAAQILSKSGRDEQSMLVTLAGIVVVLLLLVDEIALLFDRICAVFGF